MSRENAYDIFKRESIDTALLEKIEAVLQHVFVPAGTQDSTEAAIAELKREMESLKKRVLELERERNPSVKKK